MYYLNGLVSLLFDSLKKLKEYKKFWPLRFKVFLILSEKRTYFQFHTEYGKKVESQRVQQLYERHNLIAAVCDSKSNGLVTFLIFKVASSAFVKVHISKYVKLITCSLCHTLIIAPYTISITPFCTNSPRTVLTGQRYMISTTHFLN